MPALGCLQAKKRKSMKQFYLRHILLCLCLLAGINAFAYDALIDGIYYNFSGNEATVTFGGSRNDFYDVVNIPDAVEYNGKNYRVTSIGNEAFVECVYLTVVNIPESVTYIGEDAFGECKSLISANIPKSVTYIGEEAFRKCLKLTNIFIPENVTYIGEKAFSGCSGLISIKVSEGNAKYDSRNNCNAIIETESNTLIYGCQNTIIPNNVTSIGKEAFSYCEGLTSITIPSSVNKIGERAFYKCVNLQKVIVPDIAAWCGISFGDGSNPLIYAEHLFSDNETEITDLVIPEGVTSISDHAFYGCSGLTSVTIPNSVTSIGYATFYGCSSLTSVTIPNSVTSIGEDAFSNCRSLACITIPEGVTSIGYATFYSCSSLTSVTIPNSVTSIGACAFEGCSSLTSVTIPEGVTSIGNYAFQNCSGLTSVTIPNSVTSIGRSAFAYCSSLTSVTIPNSVTSIGDYAFSGCSCLTSVRVGRAIPIAISNNTFENQSNATLYVPIGSVDAYKAADYWKEFKAIVGVDEIYLKDIEEYAGKQVTLPIAMRNDYNHHITELQMDLHLPDGVTVATNSRGKLLVSTSTRMEGNYSPVGRMTEDGYATITGYSVNRDAFTGTDGDILYVTLNIANDMAAGDYTIRLNNIVLGDVNNQEFYPFDAEATLTVKKLTMGDVNDNGVVNIVDVGCILNYILKQPTGTFVEEAADIDGNSAVNINDAVLLISRYILKSENNAPKHVGRQKTDGTEAPDRLFLADLYVNPEKANIIEVDMQLSNEHDVYAVQGNVKLPDGFSFVTKGSGINVDAKNIDERSEDFDLSCVLLDNGSMQFSQYYFDGVSQYPYDGHEGGIFQFKIAVDANVPDGVYEVLFSDVVISFNDDNPYMQPARASKIFIERTDAIEGVRAENASEQLRYDIVGRKLDKPQKGINIIRNTDGTTSKVVVK